MIYLLWSKRKLSITHLNRIFLITLLQLAMNLTVYAEETVITGSDTATFPTEQSTTKLVDVTLQSKNPILLTRFKDREVNINVDGHLDEPEWANLPSYHDYRVIRPDTLAYPPYRTDFRLFYTEQGLYMSFDMEQPKETLIEFITARDSLSVNRDYVNITLDTSGDGRYGYWTNLALGGNQIDGTILPERLYSREWDGAWYGATQITDKGWSAEFFLPWSQIAMPKTSGTRRIGVYTSRRLAISNESWGWPMLPRSQPRFLSRLQQLQLDGVDPRQQWSVFPYVSSTLDQINADAKYKAGFDVFWRLASNFQLTATVNPDFGSVETDDVVVNLTADETFFPEKRLLFQEGQGIFDTTPRSSSHRIYGSKQKFTVVNTRRIGGRPRDPELPPGLSLSTRDSVQPSDLLGAAKATGQIGSFRYGLLIASEDETDFIVDDLLFSQDGRDFGALRVLYEDNHNAAYRRLGFISTAVTHPEAEALVHGVDFHYLTTNGQWGIDGQVIYSDVDEIGDGIGAFADITYIPRQGLKHSFALTSFDDKIDVNDFGYQRRNNIKGIWYEMEWIKAGLTRIRNFTISPFMRYEINGEGFRINNILGSKFEFTLNNIDRLRVFAKHSPKHFDDRNSFGNGAFEVTAQTDLNMRYQTDTAKRISIFGTAGYQSEYVDGYSLKTTVGIVWKPRKNIYMALETTYMDRHGWLLHQEDNNFTTFNATQFQPKLRLDYFPTIKQQFRIALQWVGIRAKENNFYVLEGNGTPLIEGTKPPGPTDDFSLSQLNFQLRYRWQIAPLSDLFVVYTKADFHRANLNSFEELFQNSWNVPVGDQLVVKLRYRFGF